ncbi:MAG: C40 family peptidase [Candidatus Eiseniibacteriota bacterium]
MTRRLALLVLALTASGCAAAPIYRNVPMADPDPHVAVAPAEPAVVQPADVERVAEGWLGTPYGRIDCSALAQRILGDLGADLPRTVQTQRMQGKPVPEGEIAPGDLVFFRLGSSRVNHVGVSLGGGRFVHASRSRGVVIDTMTDGYFARGFAEARRVL